MFFIIFKLMLLSISLITCMAVVVWGAITIPPKLKEWWSNNYSRFKSDNDWKIIYIVTLVFTVVSILLWLITFISEDSKYDRGFITLQFQIIAVCLAGGAAVIAFKNYQRKSGDELFLTVRAKDDTIPPYIYGITIHNAKDKSTAIFAIDVIIKDTKDRIRLFSNLSDPLIISAYSSYGIEFEKTSRYTNGFIPEKFDKDNIKFLCISYYDREIEAKISSMDGLRVDCIFPESIKNIPEEYIYDTVPSNVTHWIKFIRSEHEYNEETMNVEMVLKYEFITGYIENNILYLIPEPSKADPYSFIHKKNMNEIDDFIMRTYDKLRYSNLYHQIEEEGIIDIQEMEFKPISRIK